MATNDKRTWIKESKCIIIISRLLSVRKKIDLFVIIDFPVIGCLGLFFMAPAKKLSGSFKTVIQQ
jgi:hypothetical protein